MHRLVRSGDPFPTTVVRPVDAPARSGPEQATWCYGYPAPYLVPYLHGCPDIAARSIIESHFAPARAILATAERERVDLIAIATHGYTGVKRAILGSVTDKVLRGARWPLLLERPA